MKSKILFMLCVLAVVAGLVYAGSSGIDQTSLVAQKVAKIVTILDTILSTSATINGETIADDTIDDDSIDFGTGTDQVGLDDFADGIAVPTNAAYTVLAKNSGQVHVLPDFPADATLTMPAEAAGMYYKFVYAGAAADAQDWVITTGANANYFTGGITQFDPGATGSTTVVKNYYSDGNSNSKIGVLTPEGGTVVEMWCIDGTTWKVSGLVVSDTDVGVTFGDQ